MLRNIPLLTPALPSPRRHRTCALWAALGLFSLPSSPGTALAAPMASDSAAIQADYVQINAAFAKHDLNSVMTFYADDYTETDASNTTVSREQARRRYQDQLDQIKTMQSRYSVLSCTCMPAGVEMEIRVHTDGTGEKRVLFAKVHGSFTNDLWVRDLWVETPQGWRLKHRQTLQDDTHTHFD